MRDLHRIISSMDTFPRAAPRIFSMVRIGGELLPLIQLLTDCRVTPSFFAVGVGPPWASTHLRKVFKWISPKKIWKRNFTENLAKGNPPRY